MVTGASEGIGREFALQLAKKGFNILVSARNASALASLIAEIGSSTFYALCDKHYLWVWFTQTGE